MVTIAAPVDDGDRFLGTVALDLSFDLFNRHLRLNEQSDGTLILVNEHHQVLGHPTKVDSKDEAISYIWDVETCVQTDHATMLSELEPGNSIRVGGRSIFYVPIDHTEWRLYCIES